MQLTLSSMNVRNAIFTGDNGQVIYKTTNAGQFSTLGTTTIRKVVPNTDPMDMQDRFEVVGEIEWRRIGPSTFWIGGQELRSKDFLVRHGISGRKRTFTGPDGRSCRWDMLRRVVVLSRDDETKTEIARFHRATLGIIGPKKKPRLDIDPDVTHMLDLIILTFVFVEKLRMDKERAG